MDYYKWLTIGTLITLAVYPLAAPSYIDQPSPPSRLSVSIASVKQWLWKASQLATFGLKDDSAVVQYTWTIPNIYDEITKANHSQAMITSPSFYTDVPGYRLRLKLYLYDRNTSYIGLYLGVIKGQFDDLVSWPFDSRYELSSAGPDGTTFANASITPATETDCYGLFFPYSTRSCGSNDYMNIETLLSKSQSYLIDGALNITVLIILED